MTGSVVLRYRRELEVRRRRLSEAEREFLMRMKTSEWIEEYKQELGEELYRDVLRKLLAKRFGAVPAVAERRLDEGSREDLERWILRVVTADSVEEVFADASAAIAGGVAAVSPDRVGQVCGIA